MMANSDKESMQKLLDCIKEKENNEAKTLLGKLANLCARIDITGMTLLHYSTEHDNAEIVQHLIDQGCNVNIRNNSGVIPLMLAMQKANSTVAEILVKNSADFYGTNSSRENYLLMDFLHYYYFAPSHLNETEELKILKMIFDKVNNDFLTNKSKTTQSVLKSNSTTKVAILACANEELSRIILKNRHPINLREPKRGLTALHCALILQKRENVKFLINRGANPDVQDNTKLSALSYYIPCFQDVDDNSEVLKYLLNRSVRYHHHKEPMRSDLEYFLGCGNQKTVRTILQKTIQSDINLTSSVRSFLYTLLNNEHSGIFDLLDELDIHCNPNERDSDRRSVLVVAVTRNHARAVEFLLRRGANVDATLFDAPVLFLSLKQRRPRDSEEQNVDTEMTELLLHYGADAQYVFNKRSIIERLFSYQDASGNLSNPSAKIIIAHLALLATIDDSQVKANIRRDIESDALFAGYFESCKRQILEMKNAVVHDNVTLFDLLTENEKKILAYARNRDFMSTFDSEMTRISRLDSYYRNILTKKVRKASDLLNREKKAAFVIGNLIGINSDAYYNIVYNIMSYLSVKDQQNLCKVENLLVVKK